MAQDPNTNMVTFMLRDNTRYLFMEMTRKQFKNLQKWCNFETYYEWNFDSKTSRLKEGPYPVADPKCSRNNQQWSSNWKSGTW
jgi:hypothetical protein